MVYYCICCFIFKAIIIQAFLLNVSMAQQDELDESLFVESKLVKSGRIPRLFSAEETNNHGKPNQRTKPLCGSQLRVMAFNIWHSGKHVENGLKKIAKHILAQKPDIVALQHAKKDDFRLQEVTSELILPGLKALLGSEWSYRYRDPTDTYASPGVGILTTHAIVNESSPIDDSSVKAKIRVSFVDNTFVDVNVWSLHLDWHSYGPYAACNRLVTKSEQIYAGEINLGSTTPGRVQGINAIVKLEKFKEDLQAKELLIVAGDFNSPSHLDWTESTKKNHCDWIYDWPVTKELSKLGLKDAFRQVYPDPLLEPGNTWSPAYKFIDYYGNWGQTIPEPMDRIDMIHYKDNKNQWRVVEAFVYAGDQPIQPIPNHGQNDWPSDHASVIVDFKYFCDEPC